MIINKEPHFIPPDLFIPPDAFELCLDAFNGPLDLLLYLIRREKIDILDIPIVRITEQYMQYIDQMAMHRMALAADYLVMAAMLAEIKSRLLLPVVILAQEDHEEVDPRMELVRRLQVYERFKEAALRLDQFPRRGRDCFAVCLKHPNVMGRRSLPEVTLADLLLAQNRLQKRQNVTTHHAVVREKLLVRDRMGQILQRLQLEECLSFTHLLQPDEGKMGIVVTLLAILELAKQAILTIVQMELFSPIYLKKGVCHEERIHE